MSFPVSQQIRGYIDSRTGEPLNGTLRFGLANQDPEAAPLQVYYDAGLTQPAAQPIHVRNGFAMRGRTPTNLFVETDFSSTARDNQGRLVYSVANSIDFQAQGVILASTVTIVDAGGFFTGTDVEAALQEVGTTLASLATGNIPTGGMLDYIGTTPPTGFVFASGQTIGNASSGALSATHQRANADTSALYTLIWNSTTNTGEFVIQDNAGTPTTRGASAAADFAAAKRLPVPDRRSRVGVGKDNMGTANAAGRITAAGGNFDATGHLSNGGVQNHALTTAQLAVHAHSMNAHTHSMSAHTHTITHGHTATQAAHQHVYPSGNVGGGIGSLTYTTNNLGSIASSDSVQPTITVSGSDTPNSGGPSTANTGAPSTTNTVDAGSGSAHPNVQPSIVCTVIIKL